MRLVVLLFILGCWPNEPETIKVLHVEKVVELRACISVPPPRKPSDKEINQECDGKSDSDLCVKDFWVQYEYQLERWALWYIPDECYSDGIERPVIYPVETR